MERTNSGSRSEIFALLIGVGFGIFHTCLAQMILIRGTVLCQPDGKEGFERPLSNECVIVLPKGHPAFATTTVVNGAFDIVLPYGPKFLNKVVFIDLINHNNSVGSTRIFVSQEELRKSENNYIYELKQPINIDQDCELLVTNDSLCHEELLTFTCPDGDTSKQKPLYKRPTFLGSLGSLLGGVGVSVLFQSPTQSASSVDSTITDTIDIAQISYPKVDLVELFSNKFFLNISNNGGIAPQYNFTNAPFLNASSMVFSDFKNLSVGTEISKSINFYKTSAIISIKRFGVGLGLISLAQNDETIVKLAPEGKHKEKISSSLLNAVISIAYKMNEKLSLGLSQNYVRQKIKFPVSVLKVSTIDTSNGAVKSITKSFKTNETRLSHLDYDMSVTFNPSSSSRLGLSFNNVFGEKLLSHKRDFVKAKSLGIGASFKKKRIIVSSDLLIVEEEKSILGLRINYILNNWLDINSSFINVNETFQIGASLKVSIFRINYSFNNNLLYNSSHIVYLNLQF